jgi:hypothetical protein
MKILSGILTASLSLAVGAAGAPPAAPTMSPVPANPAPHLAPDQPLPYSHKLHVGLGLACQHCHANPAPGEHMTLPSTSTCMNCHAAMVTDRPALMKLAEYDRSKQPIPWVRIYKVLPGVTWSHRKHLDAAIPCDTCHGAVGSLEAMSTTTAVTAMASCIGCHQASGASAACVVCHAWPKGL